MRMHAIDIFLIKNSSLYSNMLYKLNLYNSIVYIEFYNILFTFTKTEKKNFFIYICIFLYINCALYVISQ